MKVLLAGIFHETHCFVPDTTGLGDFKVELGDAMLARRGDGSQIDGFLEVADREGWEIVPACSFTATPSGRVEDVVVDAFFAELMPRAGRAARGGIDAIYLSLHGAMVSESIDDVEGEVLRRLRAVPGLEQVPIFGVFDLHANLTEAMTRLADGLVCYRENPHVDARDTAVRGADLLARCLATGERPRMLWRSVPVIWPPTGTGTADLPMRELEAMARQIEAADPRIWAVNVVAGFSFGDVADAGVAFSVVTTGDDPAAEAALDRLAEKAMALRADGLVPEITPDAALDRAAAFAGARAGPPRRALRQYRRRRARQRHWRPPRAAPPEHRRCRRHHQRSRRRRRAGRCAAGRPRDLPIGGKGNPFDAGPLMLEVELVQ